MLKERRKTDLNHHKNKPIKLFYGCIKIRPASSMAICDEKKFLKIDDRNDPITI